MATVSRVLNDSDSVKEETRVAVLQAVEALNYAPNLLGRNLRRLATYNVLVLLPTVSNQFYSEIVKGISDELNKAGYTVMMGVTDLKVSLELKYVQMLENKLVDGIIFLAPQLPKNQFEALGKCYPIVQCSEYIQGMDVSFVSIDNEQASYDATKYLIACGHKKIALITSKKTYTSSYFREKGYKRALKECELYLNEAYICPTNYKPKEAKEAVKALLALKNPPTAIFGISDSLAIGAINGVREMGQIVGSEVGVIGFDDTFIAKIYAPTLTTISQPKYDMGRKAGSLLLKKINNQDTEVEHIFMPHQLVIRQSTQRG